MNSFVFVVTSVALLTPRYVVSVRSGVPDMYCLPGEACWPGLEDILRLDDSITGKVFQPLDSEYRLLSPANSQQHRRHPAIIAQVALTRDVQKVVLFAQRFNIRLTIYSAGNDYNGRSTAHGSLQISMVNMDRIDINLADSASDTGASITVQTGNTWGRIYQEVDKVGKVVVGSFDQTVSPGGFTAGSGQGPLARSLGLAVDNCIAATIVMPWHVAYLNSTGTTLVTLNYQVISFAYAELFWAILGGGGGTFGVVIDYTFKLHDPPAQLVQYVAQYPIDVIGESVMNFIHQLIPALPNQWYGLFVYAVPPVPVPGVTGIIMINMLHYGPWEQATRLAIQPLEQFLPTARIMGAYVNHTSFLGFVQASNHSTSYRGYFAGIQIPVHKLTPRLRQFYVNYVRTAPLHLNGRLTACAEVTIGGMITKLNVGANSVSQNYRQAIVSTACFLSWGDPRNDSVGASLGRTMAADLYQHSQGVYQNEPAFDLPTWKTDFWGHNYNRLLSLKRAWDRESVFYCRHCVGDDSDTRPMLQYG